MSILEAVDRELQSRQVVALESIASSLQGFSQDHWELKELLTEIVRELPDGHKALSVSVSDKT